MVVKPARPQSPTSRPRKPREQEFLEGMGLNLPFPEMLERWNQKDERRDPKATAFLLSIPAVSISGGPPDGSACLDSQKRVNGFEPSTFSLEDAFRQLGMAIPASQVGMIVRDCCVCRA